MPGFFRHALALTLTIGLIAGSVPSGYAKATDAEGKADARAERGHEMHRHHNMPQDTMPRDSMQPESMQHDSMQHDQIVETEDAAGHFSGLHKSSDRPCKGDGLTCCSMCMTAYVAPSLPNTSMTRVGFAVRYRHRLRDLRDSPSFIDPGIPIV